MFPLIMRLKLLVFVGLCKKNLFVHHGVADSAFVPPIHQPPHVSTRSACSDKTLSSILGWFILPLYGFLFILFFRNPGDLRTRWNFRISPECWKDSENSCKQTYTAGRDRVFNQLVIGTCFQTIRCWNQYV